MRHTGRVADYSFDEKGADFVATFEDPGVPYDPSAGPPDVWFREVLEHSSDLVIAFQHDGTITYVSPSASYLMGYEPSSLIGSNALHLIHPDDLPNAADTVYNAVQVEGWRPPRPFRIRHADDTYLTYEVQGMSLFHVPGVQSIVCICRQAADTPRVDAILGLLAAHASLSAILDEVVHLMFRPGWHLGVAILYDLDDGTAGLAQARLPAELAQLDRRHTHEPWGRALTTGEPVFDLGLTTVTADLAATARTHDFHTVWAIPVSDPDLALDDACIVVWNFELHPPELGQEILLRKMQTLAELALAGRSRAAALEQAANTDSLTGLANRRAFEAAVARNDQPEVAVLLIDLDGFKAINDRFGHAAGDAVIRAVADRLTGVVRHGDLPARIGGDEFAIFCRDVHHLDHAAQLAQRVLDIAAEPVDTLVGPVEFGLSVGGAVSLPGTVADLATLLHAADVRLYAAKAAGKSRHRVGFLELP